MTTWGFIGSGKIGSTVARLAVAAGHDVVLSNSRGPSSLATLVEELGPRARAGTVAEAAAAGDVVVLTVPFHAYSSVPAEVVAGKLVLDTTNYYPARDGQVAELDAGTVTSSQLVQAHLAHGRLVKAFNTIYVEHLAALARPHSGDDRSALPVAGDLDPARARARELLAELGFDTVEVGPLAESWRIQPGAPAYGTPYAADPENWAGAARRVTVEELTAAVAAATR